MILGMLAVGIAAVGGYLSTTRSTTAIDKNAPVAVQNVEQPPVKNAELILHAQGLQTHVVEQASTTIAAGLVISQNPARATASPRRRSSRSRSRPARRRRPCPALANLPLGQAQTLLENAGLKMERPLRPLERPCRRAP